MSTGSIFMYCGASFGGLEVNIEFAGVCVGVEVIGQAWGHNFLPARLALGRRVAGVADFEIRFLVVGPNKVGVGPDFEKGELSRDLPAGVVAVVPS